MGGAPLVETLEGAVWLLTPISQLLVVASIFRNKLTRYFPAFLAFLFFDVVRSGTLWWLGRSPFSHAYRDIWVATEPIYLGCEFVVVLELYRLLYQAYPGIRTFARGLIVLGVLVSLGVTFGTVRVDVGRIVWTVPNLQRLFVVKRVVCSMLGVLVLTTMALFPRARSAHNVLLHGWLLAALLNITAVSFFAINVGTNTEWIGIFFLLLQILCFMWWAVGFRAPEPLHPPPSDEESRRIEKLNADLLEVVRWLAD